MSELRLDKTTRRSGDEQHCQGERFQVVSENTSVHRPFPSTSETYRLHIGTMPTCG